MCVISTSPTNFSLIGALTTEIYCRTERRLPINAVLIDPISSLSRTHNWHKLRPLTISMFLIIISLLLFFFRGSYHNEFFGGLSILYFTTKFEIDRFTNNRDLLSDRKENWKHKHTQRQMHTDWNWYSPHIVYRVE